MDLTKIKGPSARLTARAGWFLIILSLLTFNPVLVNGQIQPGDHSLHLPTMLPVITGPDTACAGVGGYIYVTDPGMTNYSWTISSGGTITSGNGTNSITVTWNSAGSNNLSVIYNSNPTPGVFPVTVLPSPVAGITISASANPSCANSQVTFTATPSNEGMFPLYEWQVNGIYVSSYNTTYTYSPANGDQISCQLTSDLMCAAGNPATSNVITMTVNPNLAVSVSISASANPVCQGTTVTFTALPFNGGSFPAYQWKVNGINAGSDSPVYSYTPVNSDVVTCLMTSGGTCTSGNPALSNPITMTVSPSQPVGVSVAASANPSCLNSPVTFTATPVNGGNNPIYEWKVDGIIVTGNTSPILTFVPANGNVITCKLTSNASCATGNPATSAPLMMVVSNSVPVSVSISPSVNPVCQGNSVTFTATPVNGGSAPFYQWSINGFNVGVNSPAYTYVPANGDVIRCRLTSNLECITGNPAISNPVTMTVNLNLSVSVSIFASSNPVCNGNSVTLTAIPYNGGTTPSYQWKVNGVIAGGNNPTYTYTPAHGDVVVCQMTSNATCASGNPATSNAITMTVSQNLPVSVSIVVSANPVCQNLPVTFTATPVNGGTSPSYQWKVNGTNAGTGGLAFTTNTLADNDVVTCVMTSGIPCTTGNPATSNSITMTIIPGQTLPVSITIAASANPSCQGVLVNYTSTAVNGGSMPQYQWMVNGLNYANATNSTFSYTPTAGDYITCRLTSSYSCALGNPANSNQITMSTNPNLPVSVSIVASANPSCVGSSVTFTATAVNGGTPTGYQWKVNGTAITGATQRTYSFIPDNGNVVTCVVTSTLPCPTNNPATSNAITMNVQPVLPVGIVISTLTNPSCFGTQVTFKAEATNGGLNPHYQWKLNGVNTGSSSSTLIFTAVAGDIITCELNSNATCVSGPRIVLSNAITMSTSKELAAGVSITASANPFCQGSTVTFTATPVNGGMSPVYVWKKNCSTVGLNSPTYSYVPSNGDFIYCQMTSNLSCAILNPAKSNAITMSVDNGTPAGICISASANPVCTGTQVTFTAIATNAGFSPTYQWKVNGSNQGINSSNYTYIPSNGNVVTCTLTSNATCVSGSPVTSNALTMAVGGPLPASVSISTPTNPSCPGSPVTFTATPVNGGSAPIYQWKLNGIPIGSSNPTFIYTPTNGEVISCTMTSNLSCVSGNPCQSNQVTMIVSNSIPVNISIAASATAVCQGTPVTYTATVANGGNIPLYQWKVNGSNSGTNSNIFTYTPVNNDVVTCQLTSDLTCGTGSPATSNSVTMTVNPVLPVSITISASCNPCCLGSPVTFTATPVNGGSAPVYQWFINCAPVGTSSPTYTYVPTSGDVVICKLTSNETCSSGNPAISNNINMIVLPILPVSILIETTVNPFCQGSSVTFNATPTNGGISPTYAWKVNGQPAGLNDPVFTYNPVNNDTVTCQLSSSITCVSGNPATSNKIIMQAIANLPVSVSIISSLNPICAGTFVLFTATPVNPGSLPTYQWKVNGANVGSNNAAYQYAPANGDVVTCVLTSSLTCASGSPATSNSITMTVYPQAPVSISIAASANPCCQGSSVTFTANPTNGGPNPLYQWFVNGVAKGTNITYSYIPVNGDIVTCRLTSNATCRTGNPATSNTITMTVSLSDPCSITIGASANPVCQGTSVTFTAAPYNGGAGPTYTWKVNGNIVGLNSPTYSYAPNNNDIVTCHLLSNSPCITVMNANSNAITMSVSPIQPVSISIAASVNPTCVGSSVTFTAAGVNGGTNPVYQWKVNGAIITGNSTNSYTYVPVNGDVVVCKLTSNATCTSGNPANSNSITMIVSANLPASISISAASNPSCQGQQVTYTATGVNGGVNPVYQWMVNGINVGTPSPVYTYSPSNGDFVTCQLTSGFSCATGNPALSNQIITTVNPNQPVNVSIVSSANPSCQGTPITFTALPVNAGSTPVYQWRVNGLDAGTNLPTYTYTPQNGDVITCLLYSTTTCPVGNPAISNAITMNVLQPVAVALSIAASTNPVCPGTLVTYTATPANGGIDPVYQWKVNGLVVGTNSPVYTYIPSNGDSISCRLTSDANCILGNPVISNRITMVVSSELTVGVSITAASNPACLGETVIYTATPENGGTNPTYQWMVNGLNVGTNDPVFSYTPSNGDSLICHVTSDLTCATGNPATSNKIHMTVSSYLPVSVYITSSANPVCTGSAVTFTAYPTNEGASPVYHWKVNGINTGPNQPTFTYNPANGDLVTCQLVSGGTCTTGSPAMSNQIAMVVSADLPVSISIAASSNPVCQGIPVTFTATSANGGSSPTYQWKVNGQNAGSNSTSYTYIPSNGDVINCILTSNLTCATGSPATSNSITMAVNSTLPAGVSITVNPSGAVCDGTSLTFTATPSNGGAPIYQWFRNDLPVGSNSPVFSYIPSNGDHVYVLMTSNISCVSGNPALSNTIITTVNPLLPVSVSIAPDQNNICVGTPVTFNATAVNGGTPVYHWFKNGAAVGSDQPAYTFTPVDGDQVYAVITSNLSCVSGSPATSETVTMVVDPILPVSVSIAADQNAICSGTTVTFTATSVNGGTAEYHWYNNGIAVGSNSATFSYSPINGDQVYVVINSSLSCISGSPATSDTITMIVNPSLPASVSISGTPSGAICAGTPVTFTASPTNGGTPSYQWYNGVTQIPGETGPSYTSASLNNADQISVVMISNATCATGTPAASNTITMTVNPLLPASVSISASPSGAICAGTPVTFSASPTNGGTPSYQWYNGVTQIAGETGPSFTSASLFNGDQISVVMISNATCATGSPATSNTITMTVNPLLPASISISALPAGTICAGTSVTFTASPTNGGTPSYQWYNGVVPLTGETGPTYTSASLVNGDQISVVMLSNATCATGTPATSNTITMTVNPLLPASVSISSLPAGAICAGTSVTFIAVPTNGGTPSYQWYNGVVPLSGETGPTYTSASLINGDQIHVVMSSTATCATGTPATSNSITLTVNPLLPASVSISALPAGAICAGTSVTFTASPTNGGSPSYQWYNGVTQLVGETGASYTSASLLNGDQISVVMTSNATCATGTPATSNTISMTVNPLLPASVIISASPSGAICAGTSVTFTASPTNGGTPSYQWYNGVVPLTGETGPTYTSASLVNGDQISVVMLSNATCATGTPATSNTISMTVNPLLPASVSISALPAGAICAGTSVTFIAVPTNGGTPSYQWYNGVVPLIGETGPTYTSATLVNGDQISVVMTSTATCATGTPATSNTITLTVNPLLPAIVSIAVSPSGPICAGTFVTFTASPTNGGSPTYQWYNGITQIVGETGASYTSASLLNGDQISVVMISNATCATGTPATSNTITMTVNPLLPASVSIAVSPSGPICAGTFVTFTASPTNGGSPTYQWYNGITQIVGETGASYTSASLLNGDQISVVMTSNATCATGTPATSNTITMTVNPLLPASVSIVSSPSGPVCAGTPVTFIASPINGGTPTYQWYNGVILITGATGPSYTSASLINGDQISVVMTSNATCATGTPATSNTITMTVNPLLPASVSISASPSGAICAGTSVTFTASPTNGGIPSYQWYNGIAQIAGETGPSYTSASLVNGDQISVVMISNATCATGSPATSNTIMMTVNPLLPASVSIVSSPSGPVCAGTPVTFTASPINGGSPTYQWYNGIIQIAGETGPSYTSASLINGDQISVVMTSNATCATGTPATSNTITMTVNPLLPASVSISASPSGAICAGTSVTFTASPTNGGIPSYQWYNGIAQIAGETGPSYTSASLVNGDQISVVMISNATCATGSPATSNTITMTVNPLLPASVSISALPAGAICAGTSVTFTAAPMNGGTPSYQWYKDGTSITGETGPTYTSTSLVNGQQINVVMTSTATCATGSPATSNIITMIVNPLLPASVSISASPSGAICQGTSVTFTASPTNGGTPSYQWYSNGTPIPGQTLSTYTSSTLINGQQVSVVMTSTATCATGSPATSNVITMIVNPLLPASVSISASPSGAVCEGTSVTFTAVPTNGGTPTYQWYSGGILITGQTGSTYTSMTLVNGELISVVMTSSATCATGSPATSNVIAMTVNPILTASVTITVSPSETICEGTPVTFTANPVNGGTPTYQWYSDGIPVAGETGSTFTPANIGNGEQINVVMTSTAICVTGSPATSNIITMTVNVLLPVSVNITVDQNNVCEGTSVTFTANPVNEGIPIYQWFKNGIPSGTGGQTYTCSPLNNDQVYVVMNSSLTCVTNNPATSNTIAMIVNPLPGVAGSINGQADVCDGASGVIYSVAPIPDAVSYIWSLPSGVNIVAGFNTSSITVDFNPGASSGVIAVYGSNGCGNGSPSPEFSVTVNPVPPTPVVTENGQDLQSSATAGNQWYYNGVLIPGATGQNYFATQAGWYWTIVTLNNCSSDTSNHVYVTGVGFEERPAGASFRVYPVPNNGCFTVSIDLPSEDTYNIYIYNGLGEQIYQLRDIKIMNKFTRQIDLRPVPSGKYVIVFSGMKSMAVSKILVQK